HTELKDNPEYLKLANPNTLNIGKLGDIEVIFLHYDTFENAKAKWERRAKRVNYENIIIKFNDQNGCSMNEYLSFTQMNYKNKIYFTSNKSMLQTSCSIYIEKYEKIGYA